MNINETIQLIANIAVIAQFAIATIASLLRRKIKPKLPMPKQNDEIFAHNEENKKRLRLLSTLTLVGMILPAIVILYTFLVREETDKMTLFLGISSFSVLFFFIGFNQSLTQLKNTNKLVFFNKAACRT